MEVAEARKSFQKDVVVGRVVRDHHDAGGARSAVGVGLKCGVPEIFGEMMLANREAQIWRDGIGGECERKCKLHGRAVRLFPLAREIEYLRIGDVGGGERVRVS